MARKRSSGLIGITVLHFIGGMFIFLWGIFLVATVHRDLKTAQGMYDLAIVWFGFAAFMVDAALSLVAGVGLMVLRNWGRKLTIALFLINLSYFGVCVLIGNIMDWREGDTLLSLLVPGGLIAIYASSIWYLTRSETKRTFVGTITKGAEP